MKCTACKKLLITQDMLNNKKLISGYDSDYIVRHKPIYCTVQELFPSDGSVMPMIICSNCYDIFNNPITFRLTGAKITTCKVEVFSSKDEYERFVKLNNLL